MRYLFIFMLLASTASHAAQVLSNEECVTLYRTYLSDFEASKERPGEQIEYFANMCSNNYSHSDDMYSYSDSLIDALNDDNAITTIDNKLLAQGLVTLE